MISGADRTEANYARRRLVEAPKDAGSIPAASTSIAIPRWDGDTYLSNMMNTFVHFVDWPIVRTAARRASLRVTYSRVIGNIEDKGL